MKRIIFFVAVFLIFFIYISDNIPDILKTLNVASSTAILFLALACFFAILAYYFLVLMDKKVFEILGINRTKWEMTKLQLSATVVNVLVPMAGASIAVLFAHDAKKRGESQVAAVTAVIVTLLADYTSIAAILLIVMVSLFVMGSLAPYVVAAGIFFLLITLGLHILVFFSGKYPKLYKKVFVFFRKLLGGVIKFFKIKTKDINQGSKEFLEELNDASEALRSEPLDYFRAIIDRFISHFMYLITLFIIFQSLGLHPTFSVILAGYAIGMLFVVVSPTPSGVGFVEGAMTLAYHSLGIPTAAAATVSILYRGLSFWFPLMIGFVLYQRENLKDLSKEIFESK